MKEPLLREELAAWGRELTLRGLCPGSSGNLSVRLADGYLVSPTSSRLGMLAPGALAKLDPAGAHVSGPPPTKEAAVHLALYRADPGVGAVVHLHAPHSMAVSCLEGLDPEAALPPLTPYFVMRVGRLPLLPYYRPGDPALAEAVGAAARRSRALLLTQHGFIVGGGNLAAAVEAAEELEATARIFLLVGDRPHRRLDPTRIEELERLFPRR